MDIIKDLIREIILFHDYANAPHSEYRDAYLYEAIYGKGSLLRLEKGGRIFGLAKKIPRP
jgi:hypothetical protein